MDKILAENNNFLDALNPYGVAKNLAERMKERRLSMNLTQEALAKKSGVSYGSIKRFETQYKISLENLLNIALALDALEEFNNLFPERKYTSIDEMLSQKKQKKRKRARNV